MPTQITDETRQELRETAARYPQSQSALLPMLHLVQSVDGYVTPEGIEECAAILDITPATVAAVATFYTMYKRRPVGDYHVGVCTNTLCAVMGGDVIFERLKDHLDVGNDETTADGKITLEHVECNAACDYAPVVMVNWEFFDNQTPESACELVDDLRQGTPVTPTRGATIHSWREAERVLAGYPDGRADEGPVAGPASLLGLEIARDRGWRAPDAESREDRSDGTRRQDGAPTSGRGDTSPAAAAEDADTSRAESETKVAEAPTESTAAAASTADVPSESGQSESGERGTKTARPKKSTRRRPRKSVADALKEDPVQSDRSNRPIGARSPRDEGKEQK
jgi:NADH-quinone oxidoreductase subunit E